MSELRNTVIEENFPAIRRKSLTNIDGLIKNTIAETFLTHVEDIKLSKPTVKQSEQSITTHLKKIHNIIDTVDDHIMRRLQNHENEVFSLVKNQIEEMREETRKIVEKLNEAIAQKNTQDEIWKLSNQLDYFKSQTYKLFNQNKKIREETAMVRKKMKEMDIQMENCDLLMQKLKKKYLKENFIKEKLVKLVKEKIKFRKQDEITLEVLDEILKIDKIKHKNRIKTQPVNNETSSNFFQSKVQVNLNSNSIHQPYIRVQMPTQQDKITQKFSIPSSFNEQIDDCLADLPPVNFIRVQSQMQDNIQKIDSFLHMKKVDKCIQTEECRTSAQSQTHRPAVIKHFSNTSYIELSKEKTGKKLDLSKNGFFVRSYNQKIDKLDTKNDKGSKVMLKKETRHMRYLSNAFNKNKLIGQAPQVRDSINRSTLK